MEQFAAPMKGELARRHSMEVLRNCFKSAEPQFVGQAQQDSKITLNKLRRACRTFRLQLNEDELATKLLKTDRNGDGAVFEDEFI